MNLNGWDLAFAIDMRQVNAALAAQRSKLFQTFDFQTPIPAKGIFGDWRIVPGGSGKLLDIDVTVQSGTMIPVGGQPVKFDGAVLRMQVALDLLPTPSGQNLGFDMGAITFQRFDTPPPGLGEIEAGQLGLAFAQDMVRRAGEVSFVLASITPVGAGAPSWLTPQKVDFAYALPRGAPDGALAIFASTGNGDVSHLSTEIDPALIGAGGVGLGLSAGLFMTNVFLPALAAGLKVSPSNLAMNGPNQVVNHGAVGLPPVRKAGETYHPRLTSLSATLSDDRINIDVHGDCDMHMNITMTFHGSSSVALSLADPKQLRFNTIGSPSFDKSVDIPWYDHLLDIVTVVAEAILQICVAAISSELSDGISHVAGTSAVCSEAPNIVGWLGGGGFTPTEATLADGLVLHGKIAS